VDIFMMRTREVIEEIQGKTESEINKNIFIL
jgi:hypothetical protein